VDPVSSVALGISSLFGGSGSDWFQATSRAAARLLRLAHETFPAISPDDGGVTVMFQVPGAVSRPEFEGMRAGRLSKAAKGLVVEVAVPETVEDVADFVGSVLVEAVEFAAVIFERKKVAADLTRSRQIARSVAKDLGHEATCPEPEI
jgi:hypothetical protein